MNLIEAAQEANRRKLEKKCKRLHLWLRWYLANPKRRTLRAFIGDADWQEGTTGSTPYIKACLRAQVDDQTLVFTHEYGECELALIPPHRHFGSAIKRLEDISR